MEKIQLSLTEIKITGVNAGAYLERKGVLSIAPIDENGDYILGISSADHMHTLLGKTNVTFGLVQQSNNREITFKGGWLGNTKKGRSVSLNEDGLGRQQLTNGVDVIVQTDAPITVFESNIR